MSCYANQFVQLVNLSKNVNSLRLECSLVVANYSYNCDVNSAKFILRTFQNAFANTTFKVFTVNPNKLGC